MVKNREFSRKLISLVLPIAFQQFMLALVSASDALMLGKLTQDALSAVSLATQITFVQNLFLAAMVIGLSMLAAQYWGKDDTESVEKIFAYVWKVTLAVSTLFFVASLCFPSALVRVFTPDALLIRLGAKYLRWVSPHFLLTGISQIYLCMFKNTGRAGISSLISSIGVVVNIVLNALLIFGMFGLPKMEIAGAAVATVIARIIELTWCICMTMRQQDVKLKLVYLLHDDKCLRQDFWKYAAPVLGNEIVWGCGFTMYSVIMGHMGSDAVAANSIANIVKNLIACMCMGLGNGGGIMVGNKLGAGRLEKAREYGGRLCKISILSGVLSGILIIALIPLTLSITDLSETANGYLPWMLVMCSYNLLGKSICSTTISGIFCAGGDSKFGLLCDTITMWCVTVPLGFLSAFYFKLPVLAVYFIINLDEVLKLPAVWRNYRKYKWVKDLTVKGDNEL